MSSPAQNRRPPPTSEDDYTDNIPVANLNLRRKIALGEIDKAKFSRFHVKAVLVAGAGFFTDAYDIFAINIAATMLGLLYGPGGTLSTSQDLGIKIATPAGTLCGQLFFGWLADLVGRKRMYGIELIIIILGTLAQSIAGQGLGPSQNPSVSIIGTLIFWRFVTGVGIGGDYPLSAIITSEFAPTRFRGRMMCAVFAMQGFGYATAAIVSTIIVAAFQNSIIADPINNLYHIEYCWRFLIGFGCVPGALALYFRLTIPETPRYTMDVERNVHQAYVDTHNFLTFGNSVRDPDSTVVHSRAPAASRKDFLTYFSKWDNLKVIIGAAYSWFALDIAYYGLNLNSSTILILTGIGGTYCAGVDVTAAGVVVANSQACNSTTAVFKTLLDVSEFNIALAAAGLIPGYWCAFFLLDSWGRKPLQLLGFAILTPILIGMGAILHSHQYDSKGSVAGFAALYALANFFQNFGPNTTTFIIPGEAFPTRYRATSHGICAACGKFGAMLAQIIFYSILQQENSTQDLGIVFIIFGAFMLTGLMATFLVPETRLETLEHLSNESQEGFIEENEYAMEVQEQHVVTYPSTSTLPMAAVNGDLAEAHDGSYPESSDYHHDDRHDDEH